MDADTRAAIESGRTVLGIELGSTRIKAVLLGEDHTPIATGAYAWENRYENKVWTYALPEVWAGLQNTYRQVAAEVEQQHGIPLITVGAIGISGMMQGYLAFDSDGELLVPFRTWRNNITARASSILSDRFAYRVPQRWSISHLYEAILNEEPHVCRIGYLTTLAGYVHWKLTGGTVIGIGDASGMFPVTPSGFDSAMIEKFDALIASRGLPWHLTDILPEVLLAGDDAGSLTETGTTLLDPSGQLRPGIPLCPPEGDAATGMVATNCVAPRTGNVSAGTAVFAMIVLEQPLSRVHEEIDLVATPTGRPVAMAFSNNCTSDLNAWIALFGEVLTSMPAAVDSDTLYRRLFQQATDPGADADGGGMLAYGYVSGEQVTRFEHGRPLFVRSPDSTFTLANFLRTHLFAALGALRLSMDILTQQEDVRLDHIVGHGGLFKTEAVGQQLMAAALDVPVSVLQSAGEGGAWGIALLASFTLHRAPGESLESFLDDRVFQGAVGTRLSPDPVDSQGFDTFMTRYRSGLAIERAAVEAL